MHVLDWRARAEELRAESRWSAVARPRSTVVEPAEQLLEEEEPEAFEEQEIPRRFDEGEAGAGGMWRRSAPSPRTATWSASTSSTSASGRCSRPRTSRKSACASNSARGELLAALGGIPVARQALLDLAAKVKGGEAPAAELILLPDGGELKKDNVEPVLKALARVQRLGRPGADDADAEDRRHAARPADSSVAGRRDRLRAATDRRGMRRAQGQTAGHRAHMPPAARSKPVPA